LFVIRVESPPIDLSTACFAIAHTSFVRSLTYGMGATLNGFSGGWARSYSNCYDGTREGEQKWAKKFLGMLGAGPDDMYISPARGHSAESIDDNSRMIHDAEKWINEQILRFANIKTEAEQ